MTIVASKWWPACLGSRGKKYPLPGPNGEEMTTGRHVLEPVRPGLIGGRLAAGAMGGIAGGLLFGMLLLTDAVVRPVADLGDTALLPLATTLIGTTDIVTLWTVHAIMSIALGVLFAAFVNPGRPVACLFAGLAYGMVLWFVIALVLLRALAGAPMALDRAALVTLVGHLLYGLGLGIVYPLFFRAEANEAMSSGNPALRRWGHRQLRRD